MLQPILEFRLYEVKNLKKYDENVKKNSVMNSLIRQKHIHSTVIYL